MPNAPHLNDFEHWRRLAQDARTLAERMGNEVARATMLRIAADYDRLAARAAMSVQYVKIT